MNIAVVSQILPDEEMPTTEDGRKAELISNALGIVGRLNPAQLYEQELNFIAEEIRLKSKNLKEFTANLWEFYELACPEYYTFLKEVSNKEIKILFKEYYENGNIFIHQPPFFGNVSPDIMLELYNTFDIQKLKFKGIHTPLIMGKLYFVKLKHEPLHKLSARSAGTTNLLDVPYKTNERQKKGNALYNTNPVRMGKFVCPCKTFLIAGNS